MVSPFPRRTFVFLRDYLSPLLSGPVKDGYSIESLFIGSSSPEDNDLIGLGVVVNSAVGTMRGFLAMSDDLCPLLIGGMVGPKIVHVIGV